MNFQLALCAAFPSLLIPYIHALKHCSSTLVNFLLCAPEQISLSLLVPYIPDSSASITHYRSHFSCRLQPRSPPLGQSPDSPRFSYHDGLDDADHRHLQDH